MFWLRNRENIFQLRSLIWRPVLSYRMPIAEFTIFSLIFTYLTLCLIRNSHVGKICNNDFGSVIAECLGVMLLHVHSFMQQMVINILTPYSLTVFTLNFEGDHFSI